MKGRRALAVIVGLLFPALPLAIGIAVWRPGCAAADLAFIGVVYGSALGYLAGRQIEQLR